MKKLISMIICLLIISLFLIGCAPRKEAALETTGVEDVDDTSSELSDVDTIDDDLDLGDLETLDSDLANLDW